MKTKCYLDLFICLTTRPINLELATDLTTMNTESVRTIRWVNNYDVSEKQEPYTEWKCHVHANLYFPHQYLFWSQKLL